MNKKVLVVFIAAIIVVGVGVYYFSYQKGYKTGYDAGKEVGRAAAQTGAGAVVGNPLEEMPSVNPFEEAVNPFKDLYQNPFKK